MNYLTFIFNVIPLNDLDTVVLCGVLKEKIKSLGAESPGLTLTLLNTNSTQLHNTEEFLFACLQNRNTNIRRPNASHDFILRT